MRKVCKSNHVRLLWLPALVGVVLCGGAILLVENSPADRGQHLRELDSGRRLRGTPASPSTWERWDLRSEYCLWCTADILWVLDSSMLSMHFRVPSWHAAHA